MNRRLIVIVCCLAAILVARQTTSADDLSPAPVSADENASAVASQTESAALHDVSFVDANHGWAVGDHGAIWHTTDGGQRWVLQKSHTQVNLHGVWFVDRDYGWAVGGATQPYLWTSQAVVLRTTDGGQTWREQLALIPALRGVKFFDKLNGVAWGRGSGAYPLGVFCSDDGGRNWRPLAVGPLADWWGGDFASQELGVLVGPQSQLCRLVAGDVMPVKSARLSGQRMVAAQLADDGSGWLVGHSAAIQRTRDSGKSWTNVQLLPPEIATNISWRSITTVADQVWIAGSPGSVILHSADQGASWQGQATGITQPVSKIYFIDQNHGWAVGALGTILSSSDGGQTWQVQRQSGKRVAVLTVVEKETQLPFGALGQLGLAEGHHLAVHLLRPPGSRESRGQVSAADRLEEALTFLGCNTISFAVNPPPDDNELSRQQTLREMVQLIRSWQPSVLIVPRDQSRAGSNLADIATQAVELAASPAELPYLTEQLLLPPWQVSRVYASLPTGERGTHRVQLEDATLVSDRSLTELVTAARSLLECDFSPSAAVDEFQLLANLAGEPGISTGDLLAGLGKQPGRLIQTILQPEEMRQQRRLAEKRRNLQNIFRAAGGDPALLAQVTPMIADLEPAAAASLLVEMASYFQASGQPEFQSEVLQLLARRFPNDPLVDQALVWLVQYYASGETAHVEQTHSLSGTQQLAGETAAEQANETPSEVRLASAESTVNSFEERRLTQAVQVVEHIAHTRPLLYSEPQVRVPWAVAEIKRQAATGADKYLESLAIRYPGEAWQTCGEAEQWIADRTRRKPRKPVISCPVTATRPQLDGRHDEPMWQHKFVQLSKASPGGATGYGLLNTAPEKVVQDRPPTKLQVAYDREFLYFAIQCTKIPNMDYAMDEGHRTYDADLTENDRVRILLDIDRDYSTYFELTCDYRGWTNDACWNNHSWNPRWYVAARCDEANWYIEAAIPWSELTANVPDSSTVWAIAVTRFFPTGELQDLTDGGAAAGPESFGLLQFK